MKIVTLILLWLLSLGALAVALALFASSYFAQGQSVAGIARTEWIWFSVVLVAGGFCALVFALAANPVSSQVIGPLKSNRARWTTSIGAIVGGAAALGGIFLVGQHALNTSSKNRAEIEELARQTMERLLLEEKAANYIAALPATVWTGADTFERLLMSRSPIDPPGDGSMSEAEVVNMMIGDSTVLCAPVPWFGVDPETEHGAEIDLLRKAVEASEDPKARLAYAEALRLCDRMNIPDPERSATIMRELADTGDPLAQALMGQRLRDGIGVQANPTEAVRLFKLSADAGNPLGQLLLGGAHRDGIGGLAPSADEAAGLFNAAAGMGQVDAQLWLADAHASGNGAERDLGESARLYLQACASLDKYSCETLSDQLYDGKGRTKNPVALRALSLKLCDDDAGLFAAHCHQAGLMMEDGEGGPRDLPGARASYGKGCQQEDTGTCTNLARLLMNGLGGPPDYPEARRLMEKSCDASDGIACNNLAVMYQDGLGVTPSEERKNEYLRRACDLDYKQACR